MVLNLQKAQNAMNRTKEQKKPTSALMHFSHVKTSLALIQCIHTNIQAHTHLPFNSKKGWGGQCVVVCTSVCVFV